MEIRIVEHSPDWAELFQQEKRLLRSVLADAFLTLEHIGSTSVPKLAAKPVIDMLMTVSSLAKLDQYDHAFEQIGYEVMAEFGITGRCYYRKGGDNRSHQIHAFAQGDSNVTRHIAFRDYLIAHDDVKQEYASLKRQVAAQCEHDITRYCQGKDSFIKHHEAKALVWFETQHSR